MRTHTSKPCIDCRSEGITTKRKTPHPGPRCSSHHRVRKSATRDRAWERRIEKVYGLSAEEYWKIYHAQGGACALCQRATGKVRKLAVDHDHQTGKIRGVLCKTCNAKILGHARDDVEFFQRCIDYLMHPPAFFVIGHRVAPIHLTET